MRFSSARVRQRRESLRWTIERAAALSGLSPTGWGDIERGDSDPHANTIALIADVLAQPVEWFFEEDTSS